jgi:AmmeMemoRadiSam system protein B
VRLREPAVAGLFYPADPAELTDTVERLLAAVEVSADERPAAAYIVPHAGYRYSGPTAAHGYARLGRHSPIGRIVLVGPAHRVPLIGAAVPVADRWRTPLGEVAIDREAAGRLVAAGLAEGTDVPHEPEHSLEVQLPFLQALGVHEKVLPICIGRCTVEQAARVISTAIGDDAVILCSTDLSHYLTETQARERDDRTVRYVTELAPERLDVRDACGFFALRGLLEWARTAQCAVTTHDLCTSADTAGAPDRVVGYCAASLHCVVSQRSVTG